MSVDLEPAGELVTAGILAHQLDGPTGGHAADAPHASCCANCGSTLVGAYCHACGQSGHVHRSLWHIVEEVLHGLLHFESKSLRTLPLLIARPGLLTRRYIDGQRTRYVAPFGLFLFCVFLLFFATSLRGGSQPAAEHAVGSHGDVARARAELEARLAELDAREEDDPAGTRVERTSLQLALRAMDAAEVLAPQGLDAAQAPAADGETRVDLHLRDRHGQPWNAPENIEKLLAQGDFKQTYPRLARMVEHAAANPDLTVYKLKGSASKLAFLLVPIALPFLWLMFLRRKDVVLYDHAVFTLYGLSFLCLWACTLALVAPVLGPLAPLLAVYPAVHLFMQLRETYGLGIGATAWRTGALLGVGALVAVLYALLIVAISLR